MEIVAFVAALALVLLPGGTGGARASDAKPLTIVVLGDSLSAGFGLPHGFDFVSVLEKALKARGHMVRLVNAGVSGDTASGGLERLDWSVPDGTDGVILELGANDMLRGLDPAVTKKALEAIILRLKERGVPVMLAGMRASPNLGEAYGQRFDAIYPDLARQYDLVLYPFFLDGVAGERGLNLADGVHPTVKGVERVVEAILPTVESFLARLQNRV